MTTNPPDRLDRIESLLERFIAASEADRQTSHERMTRIEQAIENDRQAAEQRSLLLDAKIDRLTSITERFINAASSVIETQEARITRQDALIERLDTIIERMVYREGRNGEIES